MAGAVAALAGATDGDAGLASGINTAAFQLGGAVGVAVASTVLPEFGAVFAVAAGIALVGAFVAGVLLVAPRRRVSESEKVRVP